MKITVRNFCNNIKPIQTPMVHSKTLTSKFLGHFKDIKDYSKSAYCTSKALINSWARFILP